MNDLLKNDTMKINTAAIHMSILSNALNEVSQTDKIKTMEQLLINLMDYTEQSDDELIWCDLFDSLQELKKKYD